MDEVNAELKLIRSNPDYIYLKNKRRTTQDNQKLDKFTREIARLEAKRAQLQGQPEIKQAVVVPREEALASRPNWRNQHQSVAWRNQYKFARQNWVKSDSGENVNALPISPIQSVLTSIPNPEPVVVSTKNIKQDIPVFVADRRLARDVQTVVKVEGGDRSRPSLPQHRKPREAPQARSVINVGAAPKPDRSRNEVRTTPVPQTTGTRAPVSREVRNIPKRVSPVRSITQRSNRPVGAVAKSDNGGPGGDLPKPKPIEISGAKPLIKNAGSSSKAVEERRAKQLEETMKEREDVSPETQETQETQETPSFNEFLDRITATAYDESLEALSDLDSDSIDL